MAPQPAMAPLAALATIAAGALACSGRAAAPAAPSKPAPAAAPAVGGDDGPMSDPDEYAIDHVSWDAGAALFARTGLGDPYRVGVPYPVYLALVKAYPQVLGGDLQAMADRFGMIARAPDPASDDRDAREGLPVGLHLTDDPITGVPFVVHSCALCHSREVHWSGGAAMIIGAGNPRLRIHAYDAAFAQVTRLPGFDVGALAAEAERQAAAHGVAWPYDWRQPLVQATVDGLKLRARDRAAFLDCVAGGPPGRVATIESFALALGARLGRTVTTGPDVGWAKIPDVVGFAARTTLSFDGAGEGPMDVLVVEADLAAGARPSWFVRHPLEGASLGAYLRQPDRSAPFPGPIDRAAAARGHALFDDDCAPCHGLYAADGRVRRYREDVVALADVGTDPARALAVSDDFVAAAADPRLAPDLPPGTLRTRRTGGYVPPILTSVWLHAPYGHAGQWASLAMLATPPAQRPARYTIDLAAPYDLVHVGIAAAAAGATGPGVYTHDGTRPGLGVGGHPFLSDLGPADAAAVVEYLKTL
ncbi:MAG TPA: hypothetical protein VHE35_29700 [Kofleriaceae bacterium]|nr:hypothetical protein [Kofleriaceae bacterium]